VNAARILLEALRKFDRDNGFFLASALAFSVLLSVIPACILLLSVLGTWFSVDAEMADHLGKFLQTLTPAVGPDVAARLLGVIGDRRATGLAALAGLAWTTTMIFSSLRIIMNTAFGVAKARGALHGLGVDLLMMLLSGVMLLASLLLTTGIALLPRLGIVIGPVATFLLQYLLPLLFTVVMCFMLYVIAPNRWIPRGPALAGALVTGLLWETAQHLFGWYVQHLGRYSVIYGSVSTTAIFIVWLYYSAAILLLGAEIACVIEQRRDAQTPAAGGAALPA
jgi:membrane protein